MSTTDNLKTAFAGESQANRKYTAYARQAEMDGLPGVARLFRAAAAAETVHALGHFRALGGVKDTLATLQDAAGQKSMEYALEAEKGHFAFYTEAIAAVKAGRDFAGTRLYVCPVCGHTVANLAPDACPVCGTRKFDEIV